MEVKQRLGPVPGLFISVAVAVVRRSRRVALLNAISRSRTGRDVRRGLDRRFDLLAIRTRLILSLVVLVLVALRLLVRGVCLLIVSLLSSVRLFVTLLVGRLRLLVRSLVCSLCLFILFV
jgi:hypothetical protein